MQVWTTLGNSLNKQTQVGDAVVVYPQRFQTWHVWQLHMGLQHVIVQNECFDALEILEEPKVIMGRLKTNIAVVSNVTVMSKSPPCPKDWQFMAVQLHSHQLKRGPLGETANNFCFSNKSKKSHMKQEITDKSVTRLCWYLSSVYSPRKCQEETLNDAS